MAVPKKFQAISPNPGAATMASKAALSGKISKDPSQRAAALVVERETRCGAR